jgi:hypothetical protein
VRVLLARTDCESPSPRISRDFEAPTETIPGAGVPIRIDRHPSALRWFLDCLGRRRILGAGLAAIDRAIASDGAEAVVSFMEPLAAWHRATRFSRVPLLSIGHGLRLAHPERPRSRRTPADIHRMARRAGWCSFGGLRHALSFQPLGNHPDQGWFAGPPLLDSPTEDRPETPGEGLVIRLARAEQRPEVERWHLQHPGVPIDCFYDRSETVGSEVVGTTLRFHPLDREHQRRCMARCAGIVLDGGPEDLAEAACLGKPLLHWLGRSHPESLELALDVERAGVGLRTTHFNPGRLPQAMPTGTEAFRQWMAQSDERLGAAFARLQRQASGTR